MEGLLKLKEVLSDAVLVTKKKKDIDLFFEILNMKIAKKHPRRESYEEMLSLIYQINSQMQDNFKVGNKRNLYTKKD